MVRGVRQVGNEAHRLEIARARIPAATRVDSTAINVRLRRVVNWRVAFDEPWKPRAFGAHVSRFDEILPVKLALQRQVPVLSIRRAQVVGQRQVGNSIRKTSGRKRIRLAQKRIRKCGTRNTKGREEDIVNLTSLQIRRRADGRLEHTALP